MPHRLAAGTMPVATASGVRFTLFDEKRGREAYEVAIQVLRERYGAPDTRFDHLLQAYLSGQHEIHEIATAVPGGHDGSVTLLGLEYFPH
jgi:hypothetical protein